MTLVELKAAAYDTLCQIETLQRRLAQINQEMACEAKTPKPEIKKEEEVK